MGVSKRRAWNCLSTRVTGVNHEMKVGDFVIFVADGTKGIVMEVQGNLYHIVWEDHFSSWEYGETLKKQELARE
jgi:hypothetical protein